MEQLSFTAQLLKATQQQQRAKKRVGYFTTPEAPVQAASPPRGSFTKEVKEIISNYKPSPCFRVAYNEAKDAYEFQVSV